MSAYLLIDTHVPGKSKILESTKVPHDVIGAFKTNSEIDVFVTTHIRRKGYKTIGLIYDNIGNALPNFRREFITASSPLFDHFIQKIKEQGVTTLDLITCNIDDPRAIDKINHLRTATGINIRYSIDSTGGGGNWVLESHGTDIRSTYFTDKINEYKYLLGSSNKHTAIRFFTGGESGVTKIYGMNNVGQLGDETTTNRTFPVSISGHPETDIISCGGNHTVFESDATLELYAMGLNEYGQLGTGDNSGSNVPVKVNMPFDLSGTGVNKIACGLSHTLIRDASNNVWAFGSNEYGQLGVSGDSSSNTPIPIPEETGIEFVACGGTHSAIAKSILSEGVFTPYLKTFGNNLYGQLGDGTEDSKNTPTQVSFPGWVTTINGLACGTNHTACLVNSGGGDLQVMTFGNNSWGQIGNGTMENIYTTPQLVLDISNAEQVACGGEHTIVLLQDGTVKAFGSNQFGQLGDGLSGFVNSKTTPIIIPDISNAVGITCGSDFTTILLKSGQVKTFGRNNEGQLGDGTTTQRASPVLVKKSVAGPPVYGAYELSEHRGNNNSTLATSGIGITYSSPGATVDVGNSRYDLQSGLSLEIGITQPSDGTDSLFQIGSSLNLSYTKDGVAQSSIPISSTDTSYIFLSPADGLYDFRLDISFSYPELDLTYEPFGLFPVLISLEGGGGGGGGVPCFLAGTRILTPKGYKAIELLNTGDEIVTSDGRIVPIEMKYTDVKSTTQENAPYVIPKNLFKGDLPTGDIYISPNHAIEIKPKVWVFAKNLESATNGKVKQMKAGQSIRYYHIETPDYLTDNLLVDGLVAESYGRKYAKKVGYLFVNNVGGFVRVYRDTIESRNIRVV